MAHARKPNFVFRRNGRVHLNRRSVLSTTGSRGVRISGSNTGYTMFRGSVQSTGYHFIRQFPLHFPNLASPCVFTFQLDSTTNLHCAALSTLNCVLWYWMTGFTMGLISVVCRRGDMACQTETKLHGVL